MRDPSHPSDEPPKGKRGTAGVEGDGQAVEVSLVDSTASSDEQGDEYQQLRLEVANGVAEITLNRPDRLNSLTWSLLSELHRVLDIIEEDAAIRVVILTGAGRGFCAGFDWNEDYALTYGPHLPRDIRTTPFALGGAFLLRLWEMKKPVIAAVNGPAVGGGMAIACMCDFRIVSAGAEFSSIFVKRALPPDGGLTFVLPRLVGLTRALDIMMTGRMVAAREAVDIGLATRMVEADDLRDAARTLGEELASGPSLAVEFTKALVHRSLYTGDLCGAMGQEAWAQKICFESEDVKEGQEAFLSRRPPTFTGH